MENPSPSGLNRREFLGTAAAALLSAIALSLLGCGDDKGTSDSAGAGDMVGDIADNHGHRAILSKAQIDAGSAVDLHIQNTANHDHTLSLSAEDMAKLKNGGMVTVETGTASDPANPHTHSVMFM
ncbi:MAG: hypothetical protein JF616_05830 [Fibrobacteres bacterium]|jgi:hypothetical protein|nr:hypothetical protein [Fibrobacterota bacterium]